MITNSSWLRWKINYLILHRHFLPGAFFFPQWMDPNRKTHLRWEMSAVKELKLTHMLSCICKAQTNPVQPNSVDSLVDYITISYRSWLCTPSILNLSLVWQDCKKILSPNVSRHSVCLGITACDIPLRRDFWIQLWSLAKAVFNKVPY